MVRSARAPLSIGELNIDILKDATLLGNDGKPIATVLHMIGLAEEAQVIVQTTGLLGFGAKTVLFQCELYRSFVERRVLCVR